MSTDPVHPSAVGTNAEPMLQSMDRVSDENTPADDDPCLPPQKHTGAVGLGPNYPLGPSMGDEIKGVVEVIKGKVLGKPELVEKGRKRRTGELMHNEREQDDAANPFEATRPEVK
ncbi:hypothetical protein L210DRAFT_3444931 [Boletus edulis BED1]|uniref:Uncharacterized protein n=1 Tax=Boletus edulis BED1 TaxID=1328754 RepID=A0AAD4GGR2_BOLED|nr:hypothetical protein L210DRAFT_3444931 [Boletus edulis BED1]